MDIIINAARESTPPDSKPITGTGDWLTNFLLCAGFEKTQPPLADMLRQLHQLEGEWIVIEPIHWEASHNDAMIIARGLSLPLTDSESRVFFAAVAGFLGEDGLSMHYHNAHTWLVNIDGKPPIKSIPTHLMLHQSMMPALRAMDESMYWQRLLTELQMFSSAHPGNASRAGLLTVNGFWMYGSGRFSFDTHSSILTDDEHLLAAFPLGLKRLTLEKPLAKNAMLLINDSSRIDTDQLLTLTAKHAVRWYWNNVACRTAKKNFWNRFMGRAGA